MRVAILPNFAAKRGAIFRIFQFRGKVRRDFSEISDFAAKCVAISPDFRIFGKSRRDFAESPISSRNSTRPISNLYGFFNVNVYINVNENLEPPPMRSIAISA